jgi:4-hydroxy-tetrahydrodipicolinate synthase
MTCSGVFTALITPFDQQGAFDVEGFHFHLRRQKEAGVDGLVVLGTTGETATLSTQERETVIKLARKEAGLPLMVGCGSYSTAQTVENVRMAADCGGDYALVVSPFYNKPTQEGLYLHFKEISYASPIPIVVYNNPGRTGVNIKVETLKRIADLPQICGVKECSESIPQICDILYTIKKERPEFALICGDDTFLFSMMALGGDGVISGGANLIPDQMLAMFRACKNNEFEKARALNLSLIPVFNALRLESNPIPLKAALQLLDLPSGNPRLPLTPLNPKFLPAVEEAVQWLNAIPTF